ncbi:MAG TPA: undecaprenyldiphospho-muramoylpentapeptide beta-N-acetylglucosaminyltransferase [Xanthobacteraceae bacterium]|jgi:UDP-N-acetylglucosamine--N-acetylmuramyl-(pentapeptide) pyrophosphoryl-undecaprenol N-acetylglucosamine transferase
MPSYEAEQTGHGPLVLLAAGGTGGHLFPAEALAEVLTRRGITVDLATDHRAERYGSRFPARRVHIIASETLRRRDPFSLARAAARLGLGLIQAMRVLGRIKPAAIVGFGGYPTLPPVVAGTLRGIPTLIHEQNAVMGRANRLLARRVTAIATSFAGVLAREPNLAGKAVRTGNPVRTAVVAAARTPYGVPDAADRLRLLVFGGSQGARIMADIVPVAIKRLDAGVQLRLTVVQQAREEDIGRVKQAYADAGVAAEVAPFFADLPARIATAQLVIARAGASTVAELTAIGRPAILVPLPHALDQDQSANAGMMEKEGGAIRLAQHDFTPERLAGEISALASAPQKLVAMAAAARSQGALDAAERLADLVGEIVRGAA